MSRDFKECPVGDFCLGGNNTASQCREGHYGPYCSLCIEHWFMALDEGCSECESPSVKFFLIFAACIAAV